MILIILSALALSGHLGGARQLECEEKGECVGILSGFIEEENVERCHNGCYHSVACNWYTFYEEESTCSYFATCDFVDNSSWEAVQTFLPDLAARFKFDNFTIHDNSQIVICHHKINTRESFTYDVRKSVVFFTSFLPCSRNYSLSAKSGFFSPPPQ